MAGRRARLARGRARAPAPRRPVRARRRARARADLRAGDRRWPRWRRRRSRAAAGSRRWRPAPCCSARSSPTRGSPHWTPACSRSRRASAGRARRRCSSRCGSTGATPAPASGSTRSAKRPWCGCACPTGRAGHAVAAGAVPLGRRRRRSRRVVAARRASGTSASAVAARHAWPPVGAVMAVSGRVAPLGRYDAYQRRRGAHAALEVDRWRATGVSRGGLSGALDATRRRAEAGLGRGLAPPEAALLAGMVLGQDERLSEAVRTDFKRSGLAHLLAVSGQNVVLLAMLVLGAGMVLGLPLRARLGGGARARRALRAAGGRRAVDPARGRDGSRGARRGARGAPELALVRARPRRGGDAGGQPARVGGAGLAALVRRGRRPARARARAGARRCGARGCRGRWPTRSR